MYIDDRNASQSPLFTLAAGANTNLQFLSNKYGAVEYTAGYSGKVDLPDTKVVINTIIKLLSVGDQRPSKVLKAILNGMSNGRHECANEAAFYFLDNKIVKYSRPIKSVNPRPVENVNMNVDLHPKEDWLAWLCDILVDIPVHPMNSRGKQKQKHRGKGKATRLNRAAFVAQLPSGYTRKEQDLFWRDYKKR